MKSEELGLVYGYPDKTFKPDNKMIKVEVTSVMSHITKMFQLKMMYWLILPIQMQFLHGQKHLIKKQ